MNDMSTALQKMTGCLIELVSDRQKDDKKSLKIKTFQQFTNANTTVINGNVLPGQRYPLCRYFNFKKQR